MTKNELKDFYAYLISIKRVKNKTNFADLIKYGRQYTTEMLNGTKDITPTFVEKVNNILRKEWGDFQALKERYGYQDTEASLVAEDSGSGYMKNNRLIPLYDNVASIGGLKHVNQQSSLHTSTYVDPGDWFPGITAAIWHYDESMLEYASGSILGLKEVFDFDDLVSGKNYVIEYGIDYNRVTKRVKKIDGKIMVYSTNTELDVDGTLKYPPFETKNIKRAFLVLGSINRNEGGLIKSFD